MMVTVMGKVDVALAGSDVMDVKGPMILDSNDKLGQSIRR